MSILKEIISFGLMVIPPLLKSGKEAKVLQIDRIRRHQDRVLEKRLRLEEELRKTK